MRPWQQSPDNNARGVVIWPEPEIMDITVTLYKVRWFAISNCCCRMCVCTVYIDRMNVN